MALCELTDTGENGMSADRISVGASPVPAFRISSSRGSASYRPGRVLDMTRRGPE